MRRRMPSGQRCHDSMTTLINDSIDAIHPDLCLAVTSCDSVRVVRHNQVPTYQALSHSCDHNAADREGAQTSA